MCDVVDLPSIARVLEAEVNVAVSCCGQFAVSIA